MQCMSCNAEIAEGLAFCPACGAPAPQSPAPPAPEATAAMPPAAQPTAQMPATPPPFPPPGAAAPPPAAPPAGAPVPPAGVPYGAPPPQPPKKSNALVIILIIVGLLLCCCVAAGGGGWYYYSKMAKAVEDTIDTTDTTTDDGADEIIDDNVGGTFATPDEAVESVLPDPTWIYKLDQDDGDTRTYIIGPPQSEAAGTVVVVRSGDGWMIQGTEGLDTSNMGDGDGDPQAAEAEQVVRDFLGYIMADDPEEAQKLTIEPFKYDAASAAYSNGEFTDYSIDNVVVNDDSTVNVTVTETWYGEDNTWTYYVVPTEMGYFISELNVP